jgi:hypothetical protein
VPPVTLVQLLPVSLAGWGVREMALVVIGATGSVSDNWWLARGPHVGRRLGHSATAAHNRTGRGLNRHSPDFRVRGQDRPFERLDGSWRQRWSRARGVQSRLLIAPQRRTGLLPPRPLRGRQRDQPNSADREAIPAPALPDGVARSATSLREIDRKECRRVPRRERTQKCYRCWYADRPKRTRRGRDRGLDRSYARKLVTG